MKPTVFSLVGEVCFGVAGESPSWDVVKDGRWAFSQKDDSQISDDRTILTRRDLRRSPVLPAAPEAIHPCSQWTGPAPLPSFCRACAPAMMVSVASNSTHSSLSEAITYERITHNVRKSQDLIVLCPERSVPCIQTTHLLLWIRRGRGCTSKIMSPPPDCHFNVSDSLKHQIFVRAQGLPSARHHCRGSELLAPKEKINPALLVSRLVSSQFCRWWRLLNNIWLSLTKFKHPF